MNLLTNEQIAYLKSLESKKKRRKFFLDCLVENVLGESEKNNQDALVGIQKLSNSPRYLFPHEMEEIQRLNPSFTNTTAPRTFESIEERRNYRVGELIDFVAEEVKKEISKTEESKWCGNIKLEDIIKSKLIIRGFKNKTLLNNRGLIVATIEETANEVKKCCESANSEIDKGISEINKIHNSHDEQVLKWKYTEEDMNKCFADGFWIGAEKGAKALIRPDEMFSNYLKSMENDQSAN